MVTTKNEDEIPEEIGKNKKTSKDSSNIDSNTNTEKTNEEIKAEKIKNPEIKATEWNINRLFSLCIKKFWI